MEGLNCRLNPFKKPKPPLARSLAVWPRNGAVTFSKPILLQNQTRYWSNHGPKQDPLSDSPYACRLRLRPAPLLARILLSSTVDSSQFMEVAQETSFQNPAHRKVDLD